MTTFVGQVAAAFSDPGFVLSLLIRGLTFGAAVYHLRRVLELWLRHTGEQRLQNVILATVVVVGTFAILAGILRLIDPGYAVITQWIGAVASGTLLVGMLTIVWTWIREPSR